MFSNRGLMFNRFVRLLHSIRPSSPSSSSLSLCGVVSSSSSSLCSTPSLPLGSPISRRYLAFSRTKLKCLEREANTFPEDANRQLLYYQALNSSGFHKLVVNRHQSGSFATSGETLREFEIAQSGLASPSVFSSVSPSSSPSFSSPIPSSRSSFFPSAQPASPPPSSYSYLPYSSPYPTYYQQQQQQQQQQKPQRYDPADYELPPNNNNNSNNQRGEYEQPQPRRPFFRRFMDALARASNPLFVLLIVITLAQIIMSGPVRTIRRNPVSMPENVTTTFADVKGCDEAVDEMKELVNVLKKPAEYTNLGGELPHGVLLVGPPGTGKTLLARALAGECKVPFFSCAGSDFEEMYVGLGAKRVRQLFADAKAKAPSIIFIDELDAVGGNRNFHEQQSIRQTLNQLLVEMDGFDRNCGVVVIAATNLPKALDKALTRPGRFDRQIYVPVPDLKGRKEIIDLYAKKVIVDKAFDAEKLARATVGASGADLKNIINMAAIHGSTEKHAAITEADIQFAKDKALFGAERKSMVLTEEMKRGTAFHEGGHAIMALYTDGAHPIDKATIVPRGAALGLVHQLPKNDMYTRTRKELLASMDVAMGGRVAEELIFGGDNVTSGASNDMEQATGIAREMVLRYGMSESLGLMSVSEKDLETLSPSTRKLIDSEVQLLLKSSYTRSQALLRNKFSDLTTLAAALMKYETLSGEDIQKVLSGEEL
eukprot:TRINITY_DN1324_c0_g1_i1.p1 TRINITY_DN1324_c0_g1~~TRINITY_DN1324_c0_g1_i1.p1  ORF type:complete len:711 (+),score=204.19 TRINITY_DN1324_c0_g1_i1:38-2170(+)